MIVDENGEKCSAKFLANEILLRCLGDIGSYLRENVHTIGKLSDKEEKAVGIQLEKQAIRCFKLLGVHEDDIGTQYDPDLPWSNSMTNDELWCVDKDGNKIPEDREVDEHGVLIPIVALSGKEADLGPSPAQRIDNALSRVPTSVDTMEERRAKEIKERNAKDG